MIVVVDASVAAMWFLPEPASEKAALLLDAGCDLIAPEMMHVEVGSALLKAVRRGGIDPDGAMEALSRLSASTVRFESTTTLAERALDLANCHGGSIYDALYVTQALSQEATIATNDRELAATARSAGAAVWNLSEAPPPGLGL